MAGRKFKTKCFLHPPFCFAPQFISCWAFTCPFTMPNLRVGAEVGAELGEGFRQVFAAVAETNVVRLIVDSSWQE
jgi:hypothetical protein